MNFDNLWLMPFAFIGGVLILIAMVLGVYCIYAVLANLFDSTIIGLVLLPFAVYYTFYCIAYVFCKVTGSIIDVLIRLGII